MSDNPVQNEKNTESFSNVMFENQDDTVLEVAEEDRKYTKIDNLDEDPLLETKKPVRKQLWACMSFLSPEGVHNCNIRGIKVRGVFETEEDARNYADEIKKFDQYFAVFIGPVGKWMAWDPDSSQVEETKTGNKKLDKILKKQHEQLTQLNILAGKKKKELDSNKKAHSKRVADTIKKGTKEESDNNVTKQRPSEHSAQEARNRLSKIHADRKASLKKEVTDVEVRQELLDKESQRVKSLEESLANKEEKAKSLDGTINKFKNLIDKYKNKKVESNNTAE